MTRPEADNYWSDYSGAARTKKFQIACNIDQLAKVCQHYSCLDKPTGKAAYLVNDRRLISGDQCKNRWDQIERRII